MAKIYLFMMVSIDGYFEGPNHNIDWHQVDEEFNDFAINQTSQVGTFLFGHTTYDLMKSYWPTKEALTDDPTIAKLMNETPKIVFSRTLEKVEEEGPWKNITLKHEINKSEIQKLKADSQKDIAIFGSNNLCVGLMEQNLVDEFRIMIAPIALGEGTPLFKGLKEKLKLNFVKTRQFQNGNLLLHYLPDSK